MFIVSLNGVFFNSGDKNIEKGIKQLLGEHVLFLTCSEPHTVEMRPCMNDEGYIDVSVVVSTEQKTKEFESEFIFEVK